MLNSRHIRILRNRLRSLLSRRKLDADLENELAFHLDQLAAENRAAGMPQREARQAALRTTGNVSLLKQQCRDRRRVAFFDNVRADLTYAARLLAKSPAFASVALLSLSLGIGANTAIFTLLNAVILRPLAVPDSAAIVQIASLDRDAHVVPLSYAQQTNLAAHQIVLSSLSGWLLPVLNVEAAEVPSRSAVLVVTADYYRTFPVRALLGRTLRPSDWSAPSGGVAPVAVISSQYWEERFRRDPAVLGQLIRVEGQPFTIVGVLPRGFSSPQIDVTPVATIPVETSPLMLNRASEAPAGFNPVLLCSGRLRHGVSLRQARAQLATLWPQVLHETAPPTLTVEQSRTYFSRRLQLDSGARGQSFLRNRFSDPIKILLTAVGLLLLLVCVNVATLLLARSSARSGELSLRLAIGATRGRVLQQLMTEGLLLGALAAVPGTLFAVWSSRMLLPFMWSSSVPLTISVRPDMHVLVFTATLTLVVTVLFSALPGWVALQESTNVKLRQAARSVVGPRGSQLRLGLVAGQVALGVVLLSAAGLLLSTAQRLRTAHLGFEPKSVVLLFLNPNPGGYSGDDSTAYSRELLRQISDQPGVMAASLSHDLPAGGTGQSVTLSNRSAARLSSVSALPFTISYGFFRTMRTPILSGRDFTLTDTPQSKPVAILSRSAEARLFPQETAVRHSIVVDDRANTRTLEVVGVAQDARFGDPHRASQLIVYLPMFQNPKASQYAFLEVRGIASASSLVHSVSSRVQALKREYVFWSETLSQAIDVSLAAERMLAIVLLFFAGVALFLGLLGIYGVFAFTVSRRTREFGVRMALGASRANVFTSLLREAALLVIAGIAIGLPLAFGAAKAISSRLPGVDQGDPASFLLASALLLSAGNLVAALPALRAAKVDLAEALRID